MALDIQNNIVSQFVEKPKGDNGWINGGFFVLSIKCIDYIDSDESSWEDAPLIKIAKEGQLAAYQHTGLRQPMDTLREKNLLEDLWISRASSMENLEMNRSFWNNKCVLLTGHTGFKGGWLSLWLQSMGAHIHGYALNPTTDLNFFTLADVESGMASNTIADIRDTQKLSDLILRVNPDIVFHMAAQPFVRDSYSNPVETFDINVMGTVSLLEAVRYSPSVRALVNITTDKCYENNERLEAYHEDDALGGYDPYSSSKACSELVTAAYRRSFFSQKSVGIATARAGNVIGGGDWSPDRLIPVSLEQ